MMYDATKIEVDFINKEARILVIGNITEVEELKSRLLNVGAWKREGRKAPHKPLLLLFSLSKLLKENRKTLKFDEIKNEFKKILLKFGGTKRPHPEYPFIYLKNDGIWKLNADINGKHMNSEQLSMLVGGFNDDICSILENNHELIEDLIDMILEEFFPKEVHCSLLEAI